MLEYKVTSTRKFDKDVIKAKKRGFSMYELEFVIDELRFGRQLAPKYRDHSLSGKYEGCRECHINPDWLLIYRKLDDELILLLTRTGTHSDLF